MASFTPAESKSRPVDTKALAALLNWPSWAKAVARRTLEEEEEEEAAALREGRREA